MPLTVTTAPATDVLTLAEAKAQLRISTSGDDTLITSLNTAAGNLIEKRCRRAFVTQTLTLTLPDWPGDGIELPRPPLQSVTHVKYYTGDTLTTLSSSTYHVETAPAPGRVTLKDGQSWPSIDTRPDAIEIQYVAGYGAQGVVPEQLKAAIRLQLESFWEGDTIPRRRAINDILAAHRIHSTPAFAGLL